MSNPTALIRQHSSADTTRVHHKTLCLTISRKSLTNCEEIDQERLGISNIAKFVNLSNNRWNRSGNRKRTKRFKTRMGNLKQIRFEFKKNKFILFKSYFKRSVLRVKYKKTAIFSNFKTTLI